MDWVLLLLLAVAGEVIGEGERKRREERGEEREGEEQRNGGSRDRAALHRSTAASAPATQGVGAAELGYGAVLARPGGGSGRCGQQASAAPALGSGAVSSAAASLATEALNLGGSGMANARRQLPSPSGAAPTTSIPAAAQLLHRVLEIVSVACSSSALLVGEHGRRARLGLSTSLEQAAGEKQSSFSSFLCSS